MAGSLCPAEVMRRVMTEMHMKDVTICYGMTETSPVSFQSACTHIRRGRVSGVPSAYILRDACRQRRV